MNIALKDDNALRPPLKVKGICIVDRSLRDICNLPSNFIYDIRYDLCGVSYLSVSNHIQNIAQFAKIYMYMSSILS